MIDHRLKLHLEVSLKIDPESKLQGEVESNDRSSAKTAVCIRADDRDRCSTSLEGGIDGADPPSTSIAPQVLPASRLTASMDTNLLPGFDFETALGFMEKEERGGMFSAGDWRLRRASCGRASVPAKGSRSGAAIPPEPPQVWPDGGLRSHRKHRGLWPCPSRKGG